MPSEGLYVGSKSEIKANGLPLCLSVSLFVCLCLSLSRLSSLFPVSLFSLLSLTRWVLALGLQSSGVAVFTSPEMNQDSV